jgi:hypothetical protein
MIRRSQSYPPPPPRSFSLASLSCPTTANTRHLFPENDYADWKVRGTSAGWTEIEREREAAGPPLHARPSRKKSITSRGNSRVDACAIGRVQPDYRYTLYLDSLQSLWEIRESCQPLGGASSIFEGK